MKPRNAKNAPAVFGKQAHDEGADAADRARRADRLDSDMDHQAHTADDRLVEPKGRRSEPNDRDRR